eukprot:CAMPEP_0119299244 /NCGR_PEP_ID=MMETSP1333-20130426/1350_1 /TAXON_ID=418940 /ORGANISM="Scyphosphaera apsteinii, Strain RCC1455" /LENGTH=447 /DNA_ID=CAMNT_0007300615 /DNA_START=8 /DNA_END=1351 /DNA_ORIENTATION=-
MQVTINLLCNVLVCTALSCRGCGGQGSSGSGGSTQQGSGWGHAQAQATGTSHTSTSSLTWLTMPGACATDSGAGAFDEWWEFTEQQCREKCTELTECWGFEISRVGSKGYSRCRTHKELPTHTVPMGKYICFVKDMAEARQAWGFSYKHGGSTQGKSSARPPEIANAPKANGPKLMWLSRVGLCALQDGNAGTYDTYGGLSEFDCRERCGKNDRCFAYEFEEPDRCELHWEMPYITIPHADTACYVKDTINARRIWGYTAVSSNHPSEPQPLARPSYCAKLLGILTGSLPAGAANLANQNLAGCVLKEARLSKSNFEGADFSNAILTGAHLDEAIMDKANLYDADLAYARLDKASVNQALLDKANLASAQADYASFAGASLKSADFSKASLVYAVFDGADLTGCSFANANVKHASFVGAKNLLSADFVNAKGAPAEWTSGASIPNSG